MRMQCRQYSINLRARCHHRALLRGQRRERCSAPHRVKETAAIYFADRGEGVITFPSFLIHTGASDYYSITTSGAHKPHSSPTNAIGSMPKSAAIGEYWLEYMFSFVIM